MAGIQNFCNILRFIRLFQAYGRPVHKSKACLYLVFNDLERHDIFCAKLRIASSLFHLRNQSLFCMAQTFSLCYMPFNDVLHDCEQSLNQPFDMLGDQRVAEVFQENVTKAF